MSETKKIIIASLLSAVMTALTFFAIYMVARNVPKEETYHPKPNEELIMRVEGTEGCYPDGARLICPDFIIEPRAQ